MIVIDKPTSCFNWQMIDKESFPVQFNEVNVKEDFDLLFQDQIDPVKLKEILRTSTRDPNQAVRKFLWKRILLNDTHQTQMTVEKYNQKINILFGKNLTLEAELPDFVDSKHLVFYYLNQEGKSAVCRLLNVLASAHPDITFAPLLVPLVSLFLHYMNEAESYACLLSVVESNNKITQTDIHWITTNQVFRRFAQKYAHSAYEYILEALFKETNDPDICFETIGDWMWWIFEYLPFNYVLNIVDSFLLEGQKVLYRYGIGILDSFYKSFVNSRPLTLNSLFMKDYCNNISFERLIKIAFGLRNMSRKDIENMFQIEEKAIKKYRAKTNENYLTNNISKEKIYSLKENPEFRRKSLIETILKPHLIEDTISEHNNHQTDNNGKKLKSASNLAPSLHNHHNHNHINQNDMKSQSAIRRASLVWSNAFKNFRYQSNKKWHQTPALAHNHHHSFYHHHYPQSNLNLPSFSVENTGSTILRPQQIAQLWRWLPTRYQILELELIYSTNIHGCRLLTLFHKIEFYQATILVVKTSNNSIFGAFCSRPWSERISNQKKFIPSFFGNGETFLFELEPNVQKYDWIGKGCHGDTKANQELFMFADNDKLIVGGGHEKGNGLIINSDLISGRSGVSDTFENEILGNESDFEINVLEVLSFNSG